MIITDLPFYALVLSGSRAASERDVSQKLVRPVLYHHFEHVYSEYKLPSGNRIDYLCWGGPAPLLVEVKRPSIMCDINGRNKALIQAAGYQGELQQIGKTLRRYCVTDGVRWHISGHDGSLWRETFHIRGLDPDFAKIFQVKFPDLL